MFPEELPRRLIRMFAYVGETILDPFLGSGTTSLAARNLSRNSAGYEINSKFVPIIKKKLNVGAVSEAIGKCAPRNLKEWRDYYFRHVKPK